MDVEPIHISEQFIEDMVDKVIDRLSAKLDELDISLDYIGAIMSGQSTTDVGVRQKGLGRFATDRAIAKDP
jgi:hypothetical protein